MKVLRTFILENKNKLLQMALNDFSKTSYASLSTARKIDADRAVEIIINYLSVKLDTTITGTHADMSTYCVELREFISMASRHHDRGIDLRMYIDVLKILYSCIVKLIIESNESNTFRFQAIENIVYKFNFAESIIISEWEKNNTSKKLDMLSERSRNNNILKCRVQNILDSINDIVLTFDTTGVVQQHNLAANKILGAKSGETNIIKLLGIPMMDIKKFIANNSIESSEIKFNNKYYLIFTKYLGDSFYAQKEYLLLMDDITISVEYRYQLEQQVAERTQKLNEAKIFFESIFYSSSDTLLIFNSEGRLIKSNRVLESFFDINNIHLTESPGFIAKLFNIKDLFKINPNKVLKKEIKINKPDGDRYFCVTVHKFKQSEDTFFCFSIKDITELKIMQLELIKEKQIVEEKNIALQNILDTIRKNQDGIKTDYAIELEKEIQPLLKKILQVKSDKEKEKCYQILCGKLKAFKNSTSQSVISSNLVMIFSLLSQTEEKICSLIMDGLSTKEISQLLYITEDTVQTHRKNIRKKLNISNKKVSLFRYLKDKSLNQN